MDVKALLKKKGVMVVERLGTRDARAAERLTGGALVLSMDSPPRADQFGLVSSVRHLVVQDRSYVELVAAEHSRQIGEWMYKMYR